MIYESAHPETAAALFGQWEETLIWSCLQGIMGKIYADSQENPTAVMAVLGDFTFFAGKPNPELIAGRFGPRTPDFTIMIPQNEDWKNGIVSYWGQNANVVSRYATKKEANVFDKKALENTVASLPNEYQIYRIDEEVYHLCRSQKWSHDLVSQFPNYPEYEKLGLGFVIRNDREILAGTSSYARYREGIEIEVDTKKEYRRKGLACACAAKLILACLEQGLYPSWDAQNQGSLALAEKLGYHYSHTYTAIEVGD
jgi:RimJ/RimL family protein N-acetyltransferase